MKSTGRFIVTQFGLAVITSKKTMYIIVKHLTGILTYFVNVVPSNKRGKSHETIRKEEMTCP